jgi:hypothetical protein
MMDMSLNEMQAENGGVIELSAKEFGWEIEDYRDAETKATYLAIWVKSMSANKEKDIRFDNFMCNEIYQFILRAARKVVQASTYNKDKKVGMENSESLKNFKENEEFIRNIVSHSQELSNHGEESVLEIFEKKKVLKNQTFFYFIYIITLIFL